MALHTETCQQHYICQLAWGWFGFRPGPHYVAMLQAYFDESGHPADSPVVSVATVVATREGWCAFEEQWADVLKRYQVSGLHMKEYAHCQGEFRGWDEETRKQFIQELLPILKEHVELGFGCSLSMEDWNAVMLDKLAPRLKKQGTRQFLFRCCLDAILEAPWLPQAEPIASVFEWNTELVGKVSETFDEWREEMGQRDRFPGLAFWEKGTVHGLEAADLLAYEGRKEILESYVKQQGLPPRELYKNLHASDRMHSWVITREGLDAYLQAVYPHLCSSASG